jgi:hypothetical protein
MKESGMLTREQRAAKGAEWLAHWRGWQGSGVSMAEYARREGFDADAAYRWRRILRRIGQWQDAAVTSGVSQAATKKKRRKAVRFARVAVSDGTAAAASMLLRVVLTNGRCAELQIGGAVQLGEVIGILERAA